MDAHRICVIIPTYNNATTLAHVIESVADYTSNIIVVNDGSTDATTELLERFPNIRKVSYPVNRGKGWALRKGIEEAIQQGFDHAITIDSDGQHFAKDIPQFITALEDKGTGLYIGARNMDQASVPGKSSFGNKFSNFWFWVETGIQLPDTQSGYRMYPAALMRDMKFFTRKYEFEIEVIVRLAWKKIPVSAVPVSVYYAPKETRVSHFRPFRDFSRISVLNTVLVTLTFLYIKPRDFILRLFQKETYKQWREYVFNANDSTAKVSFSVAFGVFMGIVPIWGFQLIVAIFLAMLFRLNKAIVILSANISIPPMIPLIIYLSYKMGALWMGKEAVQLVFDRSIHLEAIRLNVIQYIYGSLSLSIVAGILFGLATYFLLLLFRKPKQVNVHE